MSVSFIYLMSVVSVLALKETMLYLLHRYCSLPPEETCCSLPLEETGCSLPPKETGCFLPPEETGCSLPPEETGCSLPPEETGCTLPPKDTGWSLPPEETGCSLPPEETCWSLPPKETGCSLPSEKADCFLPPEETLLLKVYSISSRVEGFDQRKHKVHEECLHQRITRSVSIRDSQGVSPSEDRKECLHRRITRSVSIRGSQGVSPSESTRSVSIGVPIIVGFLGITLNLLEYSTKGFHRRGSIGLIRGDSSGEVPLVRPEVALLFQSEVVLRELIVVARPEVARPELVVARPEVARPELVVVARPELARPELVVARLEVARPELVVARSEVARVVSHLGVARPELVVSRPEVARLALVVVHPEAFRARPDIDLISFGNVWGSFGDRLDLVQRRLGPLIKELGEEADALPTIAPAEAPQSSKGVSEGKDAATNKLNEDVDLNEKFPDDGFDDDRDKIGKELLHLAPSPYCMPYPYDEGLSSHPPNMKGEWGEVHAVKLGILKNKLFKDPKMRKAIIDRVPTSTQLLRAEGLTLKELSNNEQEAQFHIHVEHLSAELARPKEANHSLKKANHSRCKKYKKYKAKRDSLILEKERLENKLPKILAASKQDKESFAKGKSQLDLQETELEDLKH
ncbi:hypothetical protein Tco_0449183 [Tanacetum coccineum]